MAEISNAVYDSTVLTVQNRVRALQQTRDVLVTEIANGNTALALKVIERDAIILEMRDCAATLTEYFPSGYADWYAELGLEPA